MPENTNLIGYALIILPSLLLSLLTWRTMRAWRRPGFRAKWWTAATFPAFCLLDAGMIAALPCLGLSFGPVLPAILIFFTLRLSLLAPVLLIEILALVRRKGKRREFARASLVGLWLLNLALLAFSVDAFYVEPFDLRVSELSLAAPELPQPLRIVHLSDIHVERLTRREGEMLAQVERLQPDLILLTGDYLNLAYLDDPQARQDARRLLSQLHARYGVYAVRGTVDVVEETRALFAGLDIKLLEDEIARVPLPQGELYIAGVGNRHADQAQAVLRQVGSQLPPTGYTILLYHTPDMIEVASELGFDLYLCGHTHGGQVRLPFYGAVFTATEHGKQYEQGRYQLGSTTMYLSRGIGMEGFTITPRFRFLCPPEIVVLDLAR